MKNSNDTAGNRTPDVPTCSAVPHRPEPPLCRRVTVPVTLKTEAVRPSETATPIEQTNITLILVLIYLLTATGLSPGGSTHLHTNST